jgi:hypothetical protein
MTFQEGSNLIGKLKIRREGHWSYLCEILGHRLFVQESVVSMSNYSVQLHFKKPWRPIDSGGFASGNSLGNNLTEVTGIVA